MHLGHIYEGPGALGVASDCTPGDPPDDPGQPVGQEHSTVPLTGRDRPLARAQALLALALVLVLALALL